MQLKRYAPWIGLAVAAMILLALSRVLIRYDFTEVTQSLREVRPARLGLALAFTAGSYFLLTLFDTLAIRYVGAKLPYRKIALASFTSLSIGHTVGLAALSSGAIRYRFYTRWGLAAEAVAKVIGFCAVTVGLGLSSLIGLALLSRPHLAAEIIGLGTGAVYGIGTLALAAPAAWLAVAATIRRAIRIGRWRIEIPPAKLAVAQIVVGTANFACVAAVLHQAISTVADVGYFTVAAVYVIGNVATILSHIPGGLGVIEGTVLYLLPQSGLLAAVLVFRAVYFLVPFSVGSLLFLVTELFYRGRRRYAKALREGKAA
jgi:uncharacterized membrane protein YbhN (UPF0104 family)